MRERQLVSIFLTISVAVCAEESVSIYDFQKISEGKKSGKKRFKAQNYKSLIDMNMGGPDKDAILAYSSQSEGKGGMVKIVRLCDLGVGVHRGLTPRERDRVQSTRQSVGVLETEFRRKVPGDRLSEGHSDPRF